MILEVKTIKMKDKQNFVRKNVQIYVALICH